MECRYILLECAVGSRIGYGIAAVFDIDDCTVILQSFTDICTNRDAALALAERCNALELSLCHLPDVVDDFLAMM